MTLLVLIGLTLCCIGFAPVALGQFQDSARVVGIFCLGLVILFADYPAEGVAFLIVFLTAGFVAVGLMFWLDGGRFTHDRMRKSLKWYFTETGPFGRTHPLSHREIAFGVLLALGALLVVRPIARDIAGLDKVIDTAQSVLWVV